MAEGTSDTVGKKEFLESKMDERESNGKSKIGGFIKHKRKAK